MLELLRNRAIRRTWHENEWWFPVVDVVAALTESAQPDAYIRNIRRLDRGLDEGWEQLVIPLHIQTNGGLQLVPCANIEGLLRIIQSIPSPKAAPFKRWLANLGNERIDEIANPDLAQNRARKLYEAKGYPDGWIDKRLHSIAVRRELTDEWRQRGVHKNNEQAALTFEIATATFGVTPDDHKKIKGLAMRKTDDNLRDHMTDLELIFTMLGEASTTEIARGTDAQGFAANERSAREGGTIAGNARKALEAKSGKRVTSSSDCCARNGSSAAALAVAAFIDTQARELASTSCIPMAKARKKVATGTAKTLVAIGQEPNEQIQQ